ncbi:helix-turn-helix domain-containing protein [Nocardia violaceofusca]|uniref:helix-turn-helix domain-containing protein n=1 Tax=Nocardia violaceofusca TaxID=941182 RepID=UPI0007A397A3|nr:helix-turn-helix domain-containing protein [Nocardia violaceofusca]
MAALSVAGIRRHAWRPIERDGHRVTEFAYQLRSLLDADPRLTFRKIADTVNYSHSTLNDATTGKKLPSWPVTEALLKGCGQRDDDIERWRELWEETRLRMQQFPADLVGEQLGHNSIQAPSIEPSRDVYNEWRPRPDLVVDYTQLNAELRRFGLRSGIRRCVLCTERWNRSRYCAVATSTLRPRSPTSSPGAGIRGLVCIGR